MIDCILIDVIGCIFNDTTQCDICKIKNDGSDKERLKRAIDNIASSKAERVNKDDTK
jgi:hypothetical protein